MIFVDGLVQECQHTQAHLLCVGQGGLYWTMLPLVLTNVDTDYITAMEGVGRGVLIVSERTPGGVPGMAHTCSHYLADMS